MAIDKAQVRRRVLAARSTMTPEERLDAGARIAGHLLRTPEVRRAGVVAAYVGVGTEPDTLPLLARLRADGARVLLPVLRVDDDLDWATYTGENELVRSERGLLEPSGPRLGVDSVRTAEVVLCPGVAAGRDGLRLGRGGGSYDRALARLGSASWTCVLLFDDEVLDAVPADTHDRPVDAAATPSGVRRLG